MKLVDVHSHIHLEVFDKDRDSVISRAKEAGVVAIVTSAIRAVEVEKALEVCRRFSGYVYLSIGHDPAVLDYKEIKVLQEKALELSTEIVAVGEVGLDYYMVKDPILRDIQKTHFIEWIEIANRLNKPLVVHSRSAGKYALQVVLEHAKTPVIMHAYDGRPSHAKSAISKRDGIYFSIPPSLLISAQKQKLVKELPLEVMLLESDAPALAPKYGERNEPANIVLTVKKIAELKGVSPEKVAEVTFENAINILKLKLGE